MSDITLTTIHFTSNKKIIIIKIIIIKNCFVVSMELNKTMYMRCLSSWGNAGCGAMGHVRRECPVMPCLVCKTKGHAAINCPKAKPLRTPPPEPPPTLDPAVIHKRRRTQRDV